MDKRVNEYVDFLFREAPNTKKTKEFKEEILTNLNDKYEDMLAEGTEPQKAYEMVIGNVGDVEELILQLRMSDAVSYENREKERKKSALLVSIAVGLYIISVTWVIIFEEIAHMGSVGVILMFLTCAVATGLLVYNTMSRPKYTRADDTLVEEFKEWSDEKQGNGRIYKMISSSLWSITVAIYIAVSFYTGAWHYTWIIFLVSAAIDKIIKLCVELKESK